MEEDVRSYCMLFRKRKDAEKLEEEALDGLFGEFPLGEAKELSYGRPCNEWKLKNNLFFVCSLQHERRIISVM